MKNVILLVLARTDLPVDPSTGRPARWGEVVGQFAEDHEFGRLEDPSAGRFVQLRIVDADDAADFTESYETGDFTMGEINPATGSPFLTPVTARRWAAPPSLVDEARASVSQLTKHAEDLEDRKPID